MLEQSSSTINPYSGVIEEDGTKRSTSQIGPQKVSIATEPTSITREPTEEKEKKKRFRKSYSCGNCRHRKIKCDRTFPCQPCKQRGIASQCGPTHYCKRNRESVVEEEQESNELEKKLKRREQEGVQGRYEQQHQHNPHQQQQKHTHGRHQGIDRRLRRWSESCTEGGTSVASPSDMEQQRTPSRSALDSLYRTMESFQTQISQMELRVQSAQSQATSSSSATGNMIANDPHQRHRHSTTTSTHVHHHVNSSRHRTPHHHPPDKYEMVLAHMKTLELKLDLILKRLMHMNNQAASSVQIPAVAAVAVPPLLSLAPPFGRGEERLPNDNTMSTLVQQQFNNNIGDAEFPLDQAIDRWLEQEGGLPPSGFHLDVEQLQQSSTRSQTRAGHESMAHPPYSAPTAPLSHMDGYFTGSR